MGERRVALPLIMVLLLAWLSWGYVQDAQASLDCAPRCGVGPVIPPEPPDATFESADGWVVPYSRSVDGQPAINRAQAVEWAYEGRVKVGFEGVKGPQSAQEYCGTQIARRAPGFRVVYAIPNAALGRVIGTGSVLEKLVPRAGKPPVRTRFIIMCARAGQVVVAGYGLGPARAWDGSLAQPDPATSQAADQLADLAVRVRFTSAEKTLSALK